MYSQCQLPWRLLHRPEGIAAPVTWGIHRLHNFLVRQVGVAGTSAVSASKAALRNFARTIASELISRNIRVNTVCPGVIETPLFGKLGLGESDAQHLAQILRQQIPAKRFGKPEEVATAVAFLASDDASYITGVGLAVDGGRTQL
jgi:NAD(P)-dependent dehydrogenase (short-subunit alcohol dehydrogenase family)